MILLFKNEWRSPLLFEDCFPFHHLHPRAGRTPRRHRCNKERKLSKRHKKAFLRYKREVQCISYQPTIEGGRDQRAEMVKDLKQYTPESPRDPVSAFQHRRSSIFLTFLAGRHLRQAVIKKGRRQALPYCLQEMMCGLQWTARGVTEEHKRLKVCVERIKPV